MVLALAVVEMEALVVAHKIRMVGAQEHRAKVITERIQQTRHTLEVAAAALEVLDQPNLL
jgi:hypothetical protein